MNPRDTEIVGRIAAVVAERDKLASKLKEVREELDSMIDTAVVILRENDELRKDLESAMKGRS